MKYPQLSLRETNAPYMEEMKTIAAEVIEGGWYIRGKYVSRLEEQLCAYLGCRYAVATGNGLDALRLMLRAYIEKGVMQPGDEVTLVWYMTDLSTDADPEAYTADTVVISENTAFGEMQLPDGQYAMLFEMYDATGASALSDVVLFDCANGEIMTTVF